VYYTGLLLSCNCILLCIYLNNPATKCDVLCIFFQAGPPPWTSEAGGSGGRGPPGFSYMVVFGLFFAIFQCFVLLFFGLLFCCPPGRSLIVLFFGIFCYFSVFFSVAPPSGKFSADALGHHDEYTSKPQHRN